MPSCNEEIEAADSDEMNFALEPVDFLLTARSFKLEDGVRIQSDALVHIEDGGAWVNTTVWISDESAIVHTLLRLERG